MTGRQIKHQTLVQEDWHCKRDKLPSLLVTQNDNLRYAKSSSEEVPFKIELDGDFDIRFDRY